MHLETTKKVRHGDRSLLVGNFVVVTFFIVIDSSLVFERFTRNTKVLDTWNRNTILELCCMIEN